MKRAISGFVALSCLWSGAADAADLSLDLKPVTPWHVEWADNNCTLALGFGDKDAPFIMRFEQFAPTSSFQLVLIGKELRGSINGTGIALAYGDRPPYLIDDYVTHGKNSDGSLALFVTSSLAVYEPGSTHPGKVTPEMEKEITKVTVSWGVRKIVLNSGPLDKPFEALRKCTEDMVRTWGLDPAQQATLSRKALPSPATVQYLQNRYPRDLAFMGKQGLVNLRMLVDAEGRPSNCKIQRSYSDAKFEQVACKVFTEHASFTPAADAQGNNVASYYTTTINWKL